MIFKLNFVFQIGLKFIAIALGLWIYRWQNNYISVDGLADLTKISAYTGIILGIINLGIPPTIQKFYTNNLANFQEKKLNFAHFWQAFLVLRLVSYLVGTLVILVSFRLSNTENLLSILGIWTAQFILILDLNFRSVCDTSGRSWQFSLTDFLGKFVLVCGLFLTTSGLGVYFFGQNLPNNAVNWFIIFSILAYSVALGVDFWLQRDLTFFGKGKGFKAIILEILFGILGVFKIQNWQIWFKIWQSHYKEIFFLGGASLVAGLFLRTDILFLGFTKVDNVSLNGYNNSYRLFEIASVIPTLIAPVLASQFIQKINQNKTTITQDFSQNSDNSPNLTGNNPTDNQNQPNPLDNFSNSSKTSKNIPNNSTKNFQILQQFLLQMTLLGIICMILLFSLSPLGLWLIDPRKRFWTESLSVILPLSLILIFNGLSTFISFVTVFLGNSHFELILSLANLCVATLLYFLLIPNFGIMGAATATLGIYIFDLIFRFFLFWKVWKAHQT